MIGGLELGEGGGGVLYRIEQGFCPLLLVCRGFNPLSSGLAFVVVVGGYTPNLVAFWHNMVHVVLWTVAPLGGIALYSLNGLINIALCNTKVFGYLRLA